MDPLIIRILEILLVPKFNRNALWTIAPLIFALIMLQMYFGKYKTEQLGWNTAFGNSISLMWVSMILLKYLNDTTGLKNIFTNTALQKDIILIAVLVIITTLLTITNFHHALPKRFAFILSSAIPVNMAAFFAIVLVMGHIPLDFTTFFACVVIFLFVSLVFLVYRSGIDPDKRILGTLKEKRMKRNKKIGLLKRKFKMKAKKILPNKLHKHLNRI